MEPGIPNTLPTLANSGHMDWKVFVEETLKKDWCSSEGGMCKVKCDDRLKVKAGRGNKPGHACVGWSLYGKNGIVKASGEILSHYTAVHINYLLPFYNGTSAVGFSFTRRGVRKQIMTIPKEIQEMLSRRESDSMPPLMKKPRFLEKEEEEEVPIVMKDSLTYLVEPAGHADISMQSVENSKMGINNWLASLYHKITSLVSSADVGIGTSGGVIVLPECFFKSALESCNVNDDVLDRYFEIMKEQKEYHPVKGEE